MISRTMLVAVVCGLLTAPVFATEKPSAPAHHLPTVPLMEVLEAVSEKTGRVFVVDKTVAADVVVGPIALKDLDYSILLTVLRNNWMAAVQFDDVTSIIGVTTVRQYPLPVLYKEDDSISDEQWVTTIVKIQNATASQFVPILRPLLPQQGHMAAHPESNMITIVDRYGNARRILGLIRKMDYEATQQ